MSKLLLIRHAQASFMAKNYDQLSEKGYEQSRHLGQYLVEQGTVLDKIYVGPLKRHQQTLQMVQEAYAANGISLPEPVILQGLIEHQGPKVVRTILPEVVKEDELLAKWEAEIKADNTLYKKNYLRMFHHILEAWAAGSFDHLHPEDLQAWPIFRAGVKRALEKMIEDSKHESGLTIAAFTSGGTIAASMGHILGMTDEKRIMELNGVVQNTAISEFWFSKNKSLTLKSFNALPHLVEDMVTFV